MKAKQLFFIAMMAICSVAMTVMTSCKDKDEPSNSALYDGDKLVAAFLQCEVNIESKTLEVFDVSFDFYDANGQKQNEPLTGSTWKKSIQSASLPALLGFRMNLAKKENVDLEKVGKVRVDFSYSYSTTDIDKNGKDGVYYAEKNSTNIAVKDGQLDLYLEEYAKAPFGVLFEYNANGKRTIKEWK